MLNALDGGSGMCVLWDIHSWVGHTFLKHCVLILIGSHISWGALQSLNKWDQSKNLLQPLNN